ncbi:hypothetical protein [Streptomyces coeruleofuscus]|uniref:Uncharacterized protein n=1 Tax=Streptomyces coeruleofuscus TaxID=66879 RepID=A0ABP5V4R8_9ACTN
MSDQTPSQAEGDREDDQNTTPTPTPSQAEGDRDDTAADEEEDSDS